MISPLVWLNCFYKRMPQQSKIRLNTGPISLYVCAAIKSFLKVFWYGHVVVHLRDIFRSKLSCGWATAYTPMKLILIMKEEFYFLATNVPI